MKSCRTPLNDPDYGAEDAPYVDEEDYMIDCDGLDESDMLAAGRFLAQAERD